MDVAAIRSRVLAANLAAHGVAATVRQPAPAAVVETVAIWVSDPLNEPAGPGTDYERVNVRRVVALPRSVVPNIGRGAVIDAAEATGGPVVRWYVDEIDRVDSDNVRLFVRSTP